MTPAALTGCRTHTIMDSPVGLLTLVAADDTLAGLYLSEHRHGPALPMLGERDPGPFAEAARQLEEYFAGSRTDFSLELALTGTPFQRRVWQQLRSVPYGQTITYAGLAARIGRPGACRAVGLANGRNPVSIIIPCHRVIGSDGSLTGYGGGLDRKRQLLALEQRGAHREDDQGPAEPRGAAAAR